ncbi:MAG TPA: PBP1A family penicillin-binding protein [Terriglobia bacterium]|nr:PBP1A family penicillin-binding protein [Terriglobia bacterium]
MPAAPPRGPDRPQPLPPWARSRRIFGQFVFAVLVLLSGGAGVLAGLLFVYTTSLPKVAELENYRPDVMTGLYAADGTPIAELAIEHRVIVTYDQIPPVMRDAVLSIEDRHFESHFGVDVIRIVRAAVTDLMEWRAAQGASTLTQQLSRRLFLTPEKNWRRKVEEALLAIQIERHFTKPQIFTMYANQMELGYGNFGFEAASEFYYGKHLTELSLPEAAMLAGLPQNPNIYSPIRHPDRCLERRNRVLEAMLANGTITRARYREAIRAPLGLNVQHWNNNVAPYFVEDVREFLEKRYGEEAVEEKGLKVYTTLDLNLQRYAQQALQQGLRDDDKRRGWRGPEQNILSAAATGAGGRADTLETYGNADWRLPPEAGNLEHGLVFSVSAESALVRFGDFTARLTPADFAWTRRSDPRQVFHPGDVDLFLIKDVKGRAVQAALDQYPSVQGAAVVLDNPTGAIRAMVGGYDFNTSKFNRAVQAERQVGSSFKVYVYTQAFLDGLRPFDTVVDSPISFPSSSGVWAPHNYDNKYEGTIDLVRALAESRNVPAVRLLARVGVDQVIKLCRRFGITSRLVPNLPLALGASDLTLLEHTSGFSTFPDDGLHITPRSIDRVTDYDGRVIDEFRPEVTDVIPAPIARLMVSMLREDIDYPTGTAVRARAMAQKYELGGKTGTTNDFTDAWFVGFSPGITCGVWVGFDDHRTLGDKEEGSHVALPIWMKFMADALKDRPAEKFPYAPLLNSPEVVDQILASSGTESILAERAASSGKPPSGSPATFAGTPAAAPAAAPGGANTAKSEAASPSPGATPHASVPPAPAAPAPVPPPKRPAQDRSDRAPAPGGDPAPPQTPR